MAIWTAGPITNIQNLLLILFTGASFAYLMQRAKGGNPVAIRKLPAVTALEEGVDRCAEMGRPCHITTMYGAGGVAGATGGIYNTAGVMMCGYVAGLAIGKNVPIIANVARADVYLLMREQLRQQYIAAGRADAFDPDVVRYQGGSQTGMVGAIWTTFEHEKPAFNASLGWAAADCLMVGEACNRYGIFSVSGGAEILQMPYQVLAYDYSLIADEFFAAAAYVSGDPIQVSSIASQDYLNLIGWGLALLGVLASTAGSDAISNLLP